MSELLFLFMDMRYVLLEVLQALVPLLIIFIIFQVFFLKLPWEAVLNILKGIIMTFLGLVLFLQGVKVGFLPVGQEIGEILGSTGDRWMLIPIGLLLGFLATMAEPAVRVLSSEVERASSGYIKEKMILYTLSLGVALFVALGMAKIILGISFYYIIIPGYILALVMLFFSDSTFISIAFDSGGVATGPMTVTFIMAIAIGLAESMAGREPVKDGFGLIALVALAPILLMMILGMLYRTKEGE